MEKRLESAKMLTINILYFLYLDILDVLMQHVDLLERKKPFLTFEVGSLVIKYHKMIIGKQT